MSNRLNPNRFKSNQLKSKSNQKDIDAVKDMILNQDLKMLALTYAVITLHIVFDFIAFKVSSQPTSFNTDISQTIILCSLSVVSSSHDETFCKS